MQMRDTELHRLGILCSSYPVRYVPCWGKGQTSAVSMKSEDATMVSVKRPALSFKRRAHGRLEKVDSYVET